MCKTCGKSEVYYDSKCADCIKLELLEEEIERREAYRLLIQEIDYSFA